MSIVTKLLPAALLLLPLLARAEDYVSLGAGGIHLADQRTDSGFNGWNAVLLGRYDLPPKYPPVFLTAQLSRDAQDSSDLGVPADSRVGRYDLGAGYAWLPDYCSEVYVRGEYYHFRLSSESAIRSYDSNTDGVHAGVGGHYWVNSWLKPYGEAGWIHESRGVDGPRLTAGAELNFIRYARPFVDYTYTHESVAGGTLDFNQYVAGIKIPLGSWGNSP